jgi:hypothetical protein
MHASEIAKLADIHLKDLRTRATERERMRTQFLSERFIVALSPNPLPLGPIILTEM